MCGLLPPPPSGGFPLGSPLGAELFEHDAKERNNANRVALKYLNLAIVYLLILLRILNIIHVLCTNKYILLSTNQNKTD